MSSPVAASTSLDSPRSHLGSGRSVIVNAVTFSSGSTEFPSVRGICALISATTALAFQAADSAVSTDVPSVQSRCVLGIESCTSATSSPS